MHPLASIVVLATLLISGVALAENNSVDPAEDPVEMYLDLAGGDNASDVAALQGFRAVFERLRGDDLRQRVESAYAETVFFNDTLITLKDRDALLEYLAESGERTNRLSIRILDAAVSGDNVYVRWHMEMSFDVMGTERSSNTVGMTHLRFDRRGKIVLHQDFWDSAGGFYQTLPVVGRVIRWVRNGLHP